LKPSYVILSDSKDHLEDKEIFQAANPKVKVFGTALMGTVELEIGPGNRKRYKTFREGVWNNF
jgi:hypothetical protein